MLCIINIAIAIICFLFSLSSIFNIVSYTGIEAYIMESDIRLIIYWIVSCIIAAIMAILLYRLIRKHQKYPEA